MQDQPRQAKFSEFEGWNTRPVLLGKCNLPGGHQPRQASVLPCLEARNGVQGQPDQASGSPADRRREAGEKDDDRQGAFRGHVHARRPVQVST